MVKSSSSNHKKNKGPKGKKARAKAKLERQWGEQASEDNNLAYRRRKAVLKQGSGKEDHFEREQTINPAAVGSHTDNSDNEEDDKLFANQAFTKLLDMIKPSMQTKDMSDNEQELQEEDDDEDDDSENMLQHDDFGASTCNDPDTIYMLRFNKSPLPEQQDERIKSLKSVLELTSWTKQGISIEVRMSRCLYNQGSQSPLQHQALRFATAIRNYVDVLDMATCDSKRKRKDVTRIMMQHVLHHISAKNACIRHSSGKKSEQPMRDQGFCRPSVLILMPTRGVCHAVVHALLQVAADSSTDTSSMTGGTNISQEHLERFESEYGSPAEEENQEEEEEDPTQIRRRQSVQQKKGSQWLELFGDDANADDDFKMGLAIHNSSSNTTGKQQRVAVKFFTDFYKSDIIFASPVALKQQLAQEESFDFLSSIEICWIHRADVILMQNWDHVNDILAVTNQLPKTNTEHTDFSRVRDYLLAGQSAHWRQLVVTSSYADPMLFSTFKRHAKSFGGSIQIRRRTNLERASISQVVLGTTTVKQAFYRIDCPSFDAQGEVRVKYFCEKILSGLLKNRQAHTMIFIPSYFDFIAVRNVFLKKEFRDFVSVTEYARTSEISRGRARFLQGRKSLMLYTGRAHFFHRHDIKGARHLIFLGVPDFAPAYAHQVNMLNQGLSASNHGNMEIGDKTCSCLTLYTKYDAYALERIVGSSNCQRMIKGEKPTCLLTS